LTPVGTQDTGTPCGRREEDEVSFVERRRQKGRETKEPWKSGTHENIGEVLGRSAVRVSGLHNADLDVESSILDEVHDKSRRQRSDLVSIEEVENLLVVGVVEDNTVRVSIERAMPLTGDEVDVLRSVLVRLDVVSSAVLVERTASGGVFADGDEGEEILADEGGELFQLGSTDTVGAVDGEGGKEEAAFLLSGNVGKSVGGRYREEEEGTNGESGVGSGELLVVTLSSRLSVRLRRSSSVVAPHEVVKNRSGDESSVNLLRSDGGKPIDETCDELAAGRTGVVAVDDLGGDGDVDLGGLDDLSEDLEECVVGLGVGEEGRVVLPRGVEHLSHRIDGLDAVVLHVWKVSRARKRRRKRQDEPSQGCAKR
jgi:hypothetical protein